MTVLISKKIH